MLEPYAPDIPTWAIVPWSSMNESVDKSGQAAALQFAYIHSHEGLICL